MIKEVTSQRTLTDPLAWRRRERLGCRERVLAAIDHREPDRVPIDFWAVPEIM